MKKTLCSIGLVFFSLTFIISTFLAFYEIRSTEEDIEDFNELANLIVVPNSSDTASIPQSGSSSEATSSDTVSSDISSSQTISKEPEANSDILTDIGSGETRNLAPLYQMNKDFYGWIYLKNTRINYPVMYDPKTPNKYLRKNFYGKRSGAGVPFINEIGGLDPDNIIIFGHNMRNGTMFTDIKNFLKESYFNSHRYFEFQTFEGVEYYEIFAAVELKDSDFWYTFTDAKNENEFNYMMAYIRHNATVKNDTVPKYGDKIITLSTCKSYTTSRDRIIIVGVKVANDQVR